jgi:hypothetical protein
VGHDLTTNLGICVELVAVTGSAPGLDWEGQADLGYYALSRDAQMDWGCNFGVTDGKSISSVDRILGEVLSGAGRGFPPATGSERPASRRPRHHRRRRDDDRRRSRIRDRARAAR